MNTLNIVTLVLLAVLFLLWCFLMFRMLWQLTLRSRARLDETGGGYFTWVGHSLSTFRSFATSPEDKVERRRIYLVTALLVAAIIARPILLLS